MSKQASPAVIGAFVIAGIGLALAMIMVFGGRRMFRKTAHAIVYFDGSVRGLRVGAPVKFRGVEIGSVQDVRVNLSGALQDPRNVRILVVLEIEKNRVTPTSAGGVDLQDPKQVRMLVDLGLRAELESESLVTGISYVALDIKPDVPARLVNAGGTYPEIPSLRNAIEEIPDKVNRVLTNLAAADVASLTRSLQQTIGDAHKLLGSPELARAVSRTDELTKNLNEAVSRIDRSSHDLEPMVSEWKQTATSARRLVAPEGVLAGEIDATLLEIKTAARSLRRLADQLNRDPGAIVRGGRQ